MLGFLLITLLTLNNIDYPTDIMRYDNERAMHLIVELGEQKYDSIYSIYRPLPPIVTTSYIHPAQYISATSGIAIDGATEHILWERNADASLPIASLTKLMTALVFLESNPNFDAEITIEESDVSNVIGSRLYIQPGEVVTVRDLFYTSLVGSANNATKALARSTGLNEEDFIQRMNDKARTLGLSETQFYEVTGLDPDNHSTVYEYARIARIAFGNSAIMEALTTQEYTFETIDKKIQHRIKNTNQLLQDQEVSVISAKTGYLHESRFTYVCQAEQDGHEILVVLFGSHSSEARFAEAKEIIQWSYSNNTWI